MILDDPNLVIRQRVMMNASTQSLDLVPTWSRAEGLSLLCIIVLPDEILPYGTKKVFVSHYKDSKSRI
jgi:hypothetical protein